MLKKSQHRTDQWEGERSRLVEHAVDAGAPRSPLASLPGAQLGSAALDDAELTALRPEIVRVVQRQVRTGTYRPHTDEVAELLVAWLFLRTPDAA